MNKSINIPKIYWLVIITLLVKLSLLPFSQTINGDAVSRIFLSINWMENPTWIEQSIWGPFHFYITGFALFIWDDQILMPKIMNIILSVLTLIPFYFFTKREFNKNGALVASLLLAICPILFHNSFLGLSETPYLLFLTLAINLVSKGVRENSLPIILMAGSFITIAAGIRYEAWIIIAIFGMLLLILKRWKLFFGFNIIAGLFPVYWLFIHWINTGDPFYGIQGTYTWVLDIMDNNSNVEFKTYLRRVWFFPFSWVIAIGIPTGFIILKTLIKSYKKESRNKHLMLLSIPFLIMLLFFEYNTFRGVLLTQHRFIGTLVILSLPFIAIYFKELSSKKNKQIWLFSTLTIGLSFFYNTSHVKPFPRLEDQNMAEISETINTTIDYNSSLILDFVGWDYTYFIALQSKVSQEKMVICQGATNSELPLSSIDKNLNSFNSGTILLKRNSELSEKLSPNNIIKNYGVLKVETVIENDQLLVYTWSKN